VGEEEEEGEVEKAEALTGGIFVVLWQMRNASARQYVQARC